MKEIIMSLFNFINTIFRQIRIVTKMDIINLLFLIIILGSYIELPRIIQNIVGNTEKNNEFNNIIKVITTVTSLLFISMLYDNNDMKSYLLIVSALNAAKKSYGFSVSGRGWMHIILILAGIFSAIVVLVKMGYIRYLK